MKVLMKTDDLNSLLKDYVMPSIRAELGNAIEDEIRNAQDSIRRRINGMTLGWAHQIRLIAKPVCDRYGIQVEVVAVLNTNETEETVTHEDPV